MEDASDVPEEAKRLCHEAGQHQMHLQLNRLKDSNAPARELEACYFPFFETLVQVIIGNQKVNIRVPPARLYATIFSCCWDPEYPECARIGKIQQVIDYIKREEERKTKLMGYYRELSTVGKALVPAWETSYVGKTDQLLFEAVKSMHSDCGKSAYGNFCSIIQGSGTGKSRLVDKLAESVFTIPMNLRPTRDYDEFPLGDLADIRCSLNDFFCRSWDQGEALPFQRRFLKFLLKTIAYADKWIDERKNVADGTKDIAAEWREYLGPPRSPQRKEMYTEAVDQSPLRGFEDILDETVSSTTLQKRVKRFVDTVTDKLQSKETEGPSIIFYFDEAHHLTNTTVTADCLPRRTAYHCLCEALTYMVDTSVFALFLSRFTHLSELVLTTRNFWTARPRPDIEEIDDNMNTPFIELPLDIWRNPIIVTEGKHSKDEICSLSFKARFGRPLFWALFDRGGSELSHNDIITLAMSKLQLKFEDPLRKKADYYHRKELIPFLAARLDLTFKTNRDEAVFLEGLLVATSLRTVYSIPKHRQYLYGGYPSEPFVAEAAAREILKYCQAKVIDRRPVYEYRPRPEVEDIDKIIECYKHDIPSAIMAWLNCGLIDIGTRGELVARMLVTLAHDIAVMKIPSFADDYIRRKASFSHMVPVVEFLRALIPEEYIDKVLKSKATNVSGALSGTTLEEAFKDGYVHFTQFVKARNMSTIIDEVAYLLFVRAAAVQSYNDVTEADVVIPVWIRRNDYPDRWCMTAIFIQIKDKADKQFVFVDAQQTFDFFTASTVPANKERPYITIAMELNTLVAERKKHPQPTLARGRKTNKRGEERLKQSPIAMATISEPDDVLPEISSTAEAHDISPEPDKLPHDTKRPDTHPRYEITIRGCSSRVYNVIGTDDSRYSAFIEHEDMLQGHPRHGAEYINIIKQMKPHWEANSSYHWTGMRNESRLGAATFEHEDDTCGAETDSDGCEDSDVEMEQEEGVDVGQAGETSASA